ncbi:MAG: hypothetical protein OXE58_15935 [Acidobacteria bacterium]|nr:hypothetical protein [Acidobacteriota bacterium]
MEIDEIFDTFCLRVTEIELYRSVARDTTRPVVRRLDEIAQAEADRTGDVSVPFSVQSMGFRDPESGEYVRYGAAVSRTEDRAQQVVRQQNRQYGWLLVEAYEEFEDFLERTYAWLGRHDWQAWRLGEFGNIRHAELSEQPFRWYVETVRHKFAQNRRKILDRLRDLYPGLADREARNKLGRNLRLSVELIANLRHKIVHSRGRISDRNDFVRDVITQCGLWNNGRPKAEHREAVEKYLSPDADDWVVTLIEVSVPPPDGAPPGFWRALSPHSDICGKLISDLVADAALVHRCVSSHPAAPPAA